ncbi:MAG TPA: dockerin type I repeat-containing protein, partial [Phycisphaerae bacterium]|nr:dockerin type I repeat-containing protein [Phycisphaerae bacterium]
IPAGGSNRVPILGIDFLGGPLLDLDGNPAAPRSLVPVDGQSPVEIPGSSSHIDLAFNLTNSTVTLQNFDATGTNEGGPGIQPEIATTLVTRAGTSPDGTLGAAINPSIDTRSGALTPFTGATGTLKGVYQISSLGFELWYDAIDPTSSSADTLGTLQHLGTFRGWLVTRDCTTGQFPTLTGQGLGSTLWPSVNSALIGHTFNTAVTDFGPTATIANGNSSDQFTAAGNGGIALAGGDLGVYFDNVVLPLISPAAQAFVYLEAAGVGINNSGDPVFGDTTGYDVVVVAASNDAVPARAGDVNQDGVVNTADASLLADVLVNPVAYPACVTAQADVNGDGAANGLDVAALVHLLLQ